MSRFRATQEKYVVNRKLSVDVKYQIRNGQVIMDLKDLTDSILDEEGIGKYKTEKMSLNIPFDMNKQVTGNTINLVVNQKRFLLRLQALEILPSKQQKIDYDNTHPNRWSVPNWIKLIEDLFYQTYGFKAMELDLRGPQGGVRRGKVYGNINSLRKKILGVRGMNLSEKDMLHYVRWAFTFKSSKATLTLGLLQSDGFIQEWLTYRKKRLVVIKKKKERKWSKD